ncbi:MAG TPA: mismatch-specific DNA-glycosylase [Acidimicrobiales bacterium]|nr:mismatch-specific DNA-glycosylase [Acidimicrobiales bacterium]
MSAPAKLWSAKASTTLPIALARLHHDTRVGDQLRIVVTAVPKAWSEDRVALVVRGGGFDIGDVAIVRDRTEVVATRARTLADTAGRGMRMLIIGLNPSWYSADAEVGYARPGNRYWPALIGAGLVDARNDRNAFATLDRHRIGMTDFVKRPSPGIDEVTPTEFREGAERVRALVEWLRPAIVCVVGLAGYRTAVDRKAVAGVQPVAFGGRPVYVTPSTSGRNASSLLPALIEHFRAANALADRQMRT